jgi:hypothetical protein
MSLNALLTEKDLDIWPTDVDFPLNYFSLELTIYYCTDGLFLKLAILAAPAADIFDSEPKEFYFCLVVATPVYLD